MGVDRVSHCALREHVMDVVCAVLESKATVQDTRSCQDLCSET